jgi:oxygen-independent coproporphyrinogen-3 oxidase
MKGLYVHIPFCEYICHYCDFVKRVPTNDEMVDSYLISLRNEINSYRKHFDTIETIYIGGGTPGMLKPHQLTYLLESLVHIHPVEYTIEVNPESYTHEKGMIFKKYGINRVSIGVQSFNKNLLAYMNRKHTNDEVFEVVRSLKELEIPYLSVDLIYAVPNQTVEDLKRDLNFIKQLDITHVSCYSLILEEKTFFYHQYLRGKFHKVEEDVEAQMFQITIDELTNQGFEQYEISNFAKHGHYSKHNLIYWSLDEYIGVGLGAHGFVNNVRTYNHRALSKYLKEPLERIEEQTQEMLLQDDLIFGLRKTKGINIETIEKKYGIRLFEKYPGLKEKEELGLVEVKDNHLRLTHNGIFLGNQVFLLFIRNIQ